MNPDLPVSRTRVAIADDHASFRAIVVDLLGDAYEVVASVGSGDELLDAVERVRPELAILDIEMPGPRGIEVVRRLRSRSPGITLLAITQSEDTRVTDRVIAAGADGVLIKEQMARSLAAALHVIASGAVYRPANPPSPSGITQTRQGGDDFQR